MDWILTELSASRADLLRILLGLPREALRDETVFAGWRPIDVLIHAAAIDREMKNALTERQGSDGSATLSADVLEAYEPAYLEGNRDRSVEEVVADLRATHTELLDQAQDLTAAELEDEIAVGAQSYSAAGLLIQRALRDAKDQEELRAWRAELPVHVHAAGEGPGALLGAAMDTTRDALLAVASGAVEADRSQAAAVGDWTVKDLIGHLADRDAYALDVLDASLAGKPLDRFLVMDFDDWNEANALSRRRQSWDRVWGDAAENRAALMDRLAAMDDEGLAEAMEFPWGEHANYYVWFFLCNRHDRNHLEDLYNSLETDDD